MVAIYLTTIKRVVVKTAEWKSSSGERAVKVGKGFSDESIFPALNIARDREYTYGSEAYISSAFRSVSSCAIIELKTVHLFATHCLLLDSTPICPPAIRIRRERTWDFENGFAPGFPVWRTSYILYPDETSASLLILCPAPLSL